MRSAGRQAELLSQEPVPLAGLAEIAPRYRGIIVDLWGTLHDGRQAFDGAIAALKLLRAREMSVCLLSNSPRPVAHLAAQLARMGIGPDCYDHLVSSGEATRAALCDRRVPWTRALGRRYYFIGPSDTESLMHGLAYESVDDPSAADFVLTTGSVPGTGLAAYESTLRSCLRERLQMVCANPDLFVFSGATRVMCAGAIARRYIALGGKVRVFGKPQRAIFRQCLQRMRCGSSPVLMVGDGLETDIAGARTAGIDAAFIPGPLYVGELGEPADLLPDRLARLFERTGCRPDYILPAFRW